MYLQQITLTNFKNHISRELQFQDINIIYGPNGAGKTNLLEAIYVAILGKGFGHGSDKDLVNWNKDCCSTQAVFVSKNNTHEQQVHINKVKQYGAKTYKVNNSNKSKSNFVNNITCVLFSPDDLRIVTGAPTERRTFIDNCLIFDQNYHRHIIQYGKVIRQRNKLLERIREGYEDTSGLVYWDKELIALAETIENTRSEFFKYTNNRLPNVISEFKNMFSKKTDEKVDIFVQYLSKPVTLESLSEYRAREIATASTLRGPHRADFTINVNSYNQSIFGSRGQQRAIILALKKIQLMYTEYETGTKPLLLLDDIFSEFDEAAKEAVKRLINSHQTFITVATTKLDNLDKNMFPDRKVAFFLL